MTLLAKSQPKHDRWGRPLIVPADGGKAKAYDRISGMSSAVDDRYALELWGKRMVAQGLTMRPDLIAEAVAAKGDKQTLNRVAEAAIDAAKGDAAARMGTALHSLCEQLDAGDLDLSAIPGDLAADVRAYQTCISAAGIQVLESEQFVVCEKIGCAGTLDRLLLLPDGRKVIGDIKTGQSVVEFGSGSAAIQVAIYAHAETVYDVDKQEHIPRDQDIDSEVGILIALPAGSGTCTLHELDLVAGWEAAQMARQVKTWRKRKDLARPYVTPEHAAHIADLAGFADYSPRVAMPEYQNILTTFTISPTRLPPAREWLQDRYTALPDDANKSFKLRAKVAGLPFFDKADAGQLDALEALLDDVERDYSVPFAPRPGYFMATNPVSGNPYEAKVTVGTAMTGSQDVPAGDAAVKEPLGALSLVARWHALDADSPAVDNETVDAIATRLQALPPDAERDYDVPFAPTATGNVPAGPAEHLPDDKPGKGSGIAGEQSAAARVALTARWHALDADSPAVDSETVEAIAKRLQALPPDADALGASFQRQARDAGLDLRLKVKPTERRFAVMRALCLLLEAGCDEAVIRVAIMHVFPPPPNDGVWAWDEIGVHLALLTQDEAQRLGDLALAIGTDITIAVDDDGLRLVGDLGRFAA